MSATLDVSVVVPTIGRTTLLERCLESIIACRPGPAEVIVVDQSGGPEVADMLARRRWGVRRIGDPGRGIPRATNAGLRAASHERVLVTHDDCTVAADWIAAADGLAGLAPEAVLTGAVLAAGPDPSGVPSTRDDPSPRVFRGHHRPDMLYPNNMLLPRTPSLALGGFDERLVPAAEDNDFCYRWLLAGGAVRYEPAMRVWHHDWRTREELRRLYLGYGRGQGAFYAKHLRRGDLSVLAFLASDLGYALGTTAKLRLEPRAQHAFVGTLAGMVRSWTTFGRRG